MLYANFLHPFTSESARIGPIPFITIIGTRMFSGPDELAIHRENQWHRGGQHFTTILLDDVVRLRFESDSGSDFYEHGPTRGIKIVDGSIRHGDGYESVLARLDETADCWSLYAEKVAWRRVTVLRA